MIPAVVVAGGPDGSARSTVALNIAVGLSSLGYPVELIDRDPSAPLARALAPGDAAALPQSVVLEAGAGLGLSVRSGGSGARVVLRLVDAGPALDAASIGSLRESALVVVPLDASEAARHALDLIAEALVGEPDRLRVLLSRLLPRDADRWRLVDDLDERFAGSVSPVTVPMGRLDRARGGATASAAATLYAPTGRAARAYRAVAREVASRVGLAPVGDDK